MTSLSRYFCNPSAGLSVFTGIACHAAEPAARISLTPGGLSIAAQGVLPQVAALEASSQLTSWSMLRVIAVDPRARRNPSGFPGLPLPITEDGTTQFFLPPPSEPTALLYRVRSPERWWEEARANWLQKRPREYRYHYRRSCFCLGQPSDVLIHVREDQVLDVQEIGPDGPIPGPSGLDPSGYPTVDELFKRLEEAVQNHADVVQVHFDLENRHPTLIYVDSILGAIDDEYSISIDAFSPLP